MSRKTRKLIWSAPLVAVLAVDRRIGHFRGLAPGAAQAEHEALLRPAVIWTERRPAGWEDAISTHRGRLPLIGGTVTPVTESTIHEQRCLELARGRTPVNTTRC